MKKGLSVILCLAILMSVLSAFSVTASAVSAGDVVEITSTPFVDDIITFDIFLKKNVSVTGAVFKIQFDPNVLEPVQDSNGNAYMTKNSYGEEVVSVNGNYTSGITAEHSNIYSAGFVSMNSYVATSKRGFFTFKFRVIDKSYPVTNIKFYCVEFSSENSNYNIPQNEINPPVFYTYSNSTLNQTKLTGIRSTQTGLRLYWQKTPGAAGYKVFRLNNGKTTLVCNTIETFTNDNTVKPYENVTYTVRAYSPNGDLDSGYTSTLSATYTPITFNLTLLPQANSIKVSWSPVDNIKHYEVFKRETNKTDWELIYKTNTTTTFIDTNVANGSHYEYTVCSCDETGTSITSDRASTWFYLSPTVKATAITDGVSIKWNTVDGAQGYKIYRKYNGQAQWTLLSTVDNTVTSYIDKTATSGRNIDYAVQACYPDADTPIVANRIAYVGVPHLTSAANSVGGITVKWTSVENATGYRVYRRAAGEKYFTYLGTVKTNSYFDKTAKNNVFYKYTVRTVFYSIFSNYEDGLLVKCVATPRLTSISNTTAGIRTTWSTVTGATGYRVYRRGAGQSTWTYLGTVAGNTYTDTKVVKGSYYRYTVRAVSGYYSGFDTNGLYTKRT